MFKKVLKGLSAATLIASCTCTSTKEQTESLADAKTRKIVLAYNDLISKYGNTDSCSFFKAFNSFFKEQKLPTADQVYFFCKAESAPNFFAQVSCSQQMHGSNPTSLIEQHLKENNCK